MIRRVNFFWKKISYHHYHYLTCRPRLRLVRRLLLFFSEKQMRASSFPLEPNSYSPGVGEFFKIFYFKKNRKLCFYLELFICLKIQKNYRSFYIFPEILGERVTLFTAWHTLFRLGNPVFSQFLKTVFIKKSNTFSWHNSLVFQFFFCFGCFHLIYFSHICTVCLTISPLNYGILNWFFITSLSFPIIFPGTSHRWAVLPDQSHLMQVPVPTVQGSVDRENWERP